MNYILLILSGILFITCGNQDKTKQEDLVIREKNIEKVVQLQEPKKPSSAKTMEDKPSSAIASGNKEKVEDIPQEVSQSQEMPDTRIKTPPINTSDELSVSVDTSIKNENILVLDHSSWNALLVKYVDGEGNVAYKNLKNDTEALQQYLGYLAKNVPSNDSEKNERLAYYINLYNAATIKLILDNYPLKSIKDIKAPWDKKWVEVGDELLSLGHIEHKILRKMNEPRIHFAINCASYSCPKLLNEAFTATKMESQLQKTTKEFIRDPSHNQITSNKLQLSNIFRWYKKDFTTNGSLINYINSYSETAIESNAKIDYLKYDWSLNEVN